MDRVSEVEDVRQAHRYLPTRLGVMSMLTVVVGLCALTAPAVRAA